MGRQVPPCLCGEWRATACDLLFERWARLYDDLSVVITVHGQSPSCLYDFMARICCDVQIGGFPRSDHVPGIAWSSTALKIALPQASVW